MKVMKSLTIPGLLIWLNPLFSQASFLMLDPGHQENSGEAHVFAPDIISTDLNDGKLTLNKNGDELVFSVTSPPYKLSVLITMSFNGKKWSDPSVLPFSGRFKDSDPYISPGGNRLLFSSNRPVDNNSPGSDFNIWYSEKTSDKWTEPIPLSKIINTNDSEFCPAIADNGNLYFCSERSEGIGDSDIYFSESRDGVYGIPVCLPEPINSNNSEESPYIAPDESFIIYKSYRNGDFGNGDIYISYKDPNGGWTNPLNLGEKVNSGYFDSSPFLSSDFEYMFFVSNRIEPSAGLSGGLNSIQDVYRFLRSCNNGRTNIYIVKTDNIDALENIELE